MKNLICCGTAGVLLSTVPQMADAQNAPTSSTLEEIVVTATKREENLQDVSIAVSAVTGDYLRERNTVDLRDIIYASPSVQLQGNVTNNSEGFQIRGVGTSVFGGLQQSTAAVVDEVLSNPTFARQGFLDVERVEVLRGPQGMLFGESASAGLVHTITKRPVLGEFEGRAQASFGKADEFDEVVAGLVLNMPVGDTVALRLSANHTDREGYLQNFDGRKFNGLRDSGFKAKLLWQPGDTFSAYLISSYSEQHIPWNPAPVVSVTPGGPTDLALRAAGVIAQPDNSRTALAGINEGESDFIWNALHLDWDLGNHALRSITSYQRKEQTGATDTDALPEFLFDVTTGGDIGQEKRLSQELRLSSTHDGPVQYVAGLFFGQRETSSTLQFIGPLVPGLLDAGLIFDVWFNSQVEFETYAAFGQAEISLNERMRLIVGGRYNYDDGQLTYNSFYPVYEDLFNLGFPGYPELTNYRENDDSDSVSWRIGTEYDFSGDVMGYAVITRGYKGPGFNTIGVDPSAQEKQFVGPEVPTNYEIGVKSMLFGGTTRLNVTGFYTEFKDYQAQFVDFTNSAVGQLLVKNAGALNTYGVEVELNVVPVEGLSLNGGFSYIHAEYEDFLQPCYPGQTEEQGCFDAVTDADGIELANSPQWTFALDARYEFALSGTLNAFVGTNYYWRDETNFSTVADPRAAIGSYGVLGAKLGIVGANDKWRVTLWGKNLSDERFSTSIGEHSANLAGDPFVYGHYLAPDSFRQIGLSVDVMF
jgi:iron complex outermembrane recepter protein